MCCQGHLQSTLCRWPGDLFSRTLSGYHRETSTTGSECHTGMGDKEWLLVCSPQVQSDSFHCTMVSGSETPRCEDWKHTSASEGVHKVPWAVVGLAPLILEAHKCAEDTVQGGSQPHLSGCPLEMGRGQRHTLDAVPCHCSFQVWLWLHCVWHSIKTPTYDNWTAFITPDLDWYWEHSAPAQCPACTQRPMKLLWRNVGKSCPRITMWKLVPALTIQHIMPCMNWTEPLGDLYAPRPNGRGGMTQHPPPPPLVSKVEEAMTSAEINAELVCPLRTPNFSPGMHYYDPKRHDLIEGVSKCMISGQEAQAKFNEFLEAQGSHDEVYTDGSKMNERVGAAAVINHHFQNGEATCRQLSKRLPDNSTIFAAEATTISLALNYKQHMGPVHHHVVVYSESMSCLQAIEGEDTENPFTCHIVNLLWSLSDKGTRVRFCWVLSHCGIDGNKRVGQLAKETLEQDIDPLASIHFTDMKPLVNSYIRPTGKCPLYKYETTGQLLHSEVGSIQVGCSCTWQRSLSCETNTGATEEVPAPNQSWRGCNDQTLNWPYQDHQLVVTVVVKHWPLTICCWSALLQGC